MPYPLRYQSKPWATHHVVSRCFQGRSFLQPNPEVTSATIGVLGYFTERYQGRIKLHFSVFLSNHFHLLISSSDIATLSSFLQDVKSSLTKEIGRLHRWEGTIWGRRFFSEEILGEAALIDTIKYLTKNSVKEGLVDHPSQWTGVHSYKQLVEGKECTGLWVDRVALHMACDNRSETDIEEFTTCYSLRLTPPPSWEFLSDDVFKYICQEIMDNAIEEALLAREGGSIGMDKVLSGDPLEVRERCGSEATPRLSEPPCKSRCPVLLEEYKRSYFEFKSQFQSASFELRRALKRGLKSVDLRFPPGGIPLFGGGGLVSMDAA